MMKWYELRFRPGLRGALRCMLLALLLIVSIAPARAAPGQITGTFRGTDVGRDVTYTFAGQVQTHWAGSLLLDIDNGTTVPVFCIQIQVAVRTGDRYKNDGPVKALAGGCQIQYLLEKYPASTASTPDEAAARQLAIWVFSDNLDPNTITDAAIRNRAIALVNEAMLGQCPSQRADPPALTLTPPSASAGLGQTVTYTVQAGAQDAGATVNVTVAGPAALTDGQQQGAVTLDGQGAGTFGVRITGVGDVTVSVALSYRLLAGVVFSQLDENVKTQRLVVAGGLDRVATATAQLSSAASTATPTVPVTPTLAPAPLPSETPTTEQPAPPPTRRPSKPRPTQPPEVTPTAEQPTPIAEQPTATAAIVVAVTPQAPVAPPASGAPAGAAQQPVRLPNTGDRANAAPGISLGIAALLLVGGWLICKRGARS